MLFRVPSALSSNAAAAAVPVALPFTVHGNGGSSRDAVPAATTATTTQRLVDQAIRESSLQAAATTVSHCKHRALLSAVAVAGSEIARIGGAAAGAGSSRSKIDVIAGLSRHATLPALATFHDEGESFERAVALGIAAGCEASVGVCALKHCFQQQASIFQMASEAGKRKRRRANRSFDDLFTRMRLQLHDGGRCGEQCSFVLVNAPSASFADVILLTRRAVVLVQVKNMAAHNPTQKKLGDALWRTLAQPNCLRRLIAACYERRQPEVHSVLCMRAERHAHLYEQWIQPQLRPGRHFLLIRPEPTQHVVDDKSTTATAARSFVVEAYHGSKTAPPERFLPSRVSFERFVRAVDGSAQLGFARQLLQSSSQDAINGVSAQLSWRLRPSLMQQVLMAGAVCATIAGARRAPVDGAATMRNRVELMRDASTIKSLAEFAQFAGDPGSFERAVAMGIAAGCEGSVGVCALKHCLQHQVPIPQLANESAKWHRRRADAYFDDLFTRIRLQLHDSSGGEQWSFVLVNAPRASFADVILLTRRAVVLVQVKTDSYELTKTFSSASIWPTLGATKSSPARRCLEKLMAQLYDEPEKVQRHFVVLAQSFGQAHLFSRWFQRTANARGAQNRHLLLIRPKIDRLVALTSGRPTIDRRENLRQNRAARAASDEWKLEYQRSRK